MLQKFKELLLNETAELIGNSAEGKPESFQRAMQDLILEDFNIQLSLLACASARWCGADEKTGLPAAVASLLLKTAVSAHLETESLRGIFPGIKGNPDIDETTLILAGDGLLALAMEYLAFSCGLHSSRLIFEAVQAVGARGMLEGLSLALDHRKGKEVAVPDGRSIHELYSGQLARFASHGGAMLAGASDLMLDDAARIGVLVGRARFLARKAEESEPAIAKDLMFQAGNLTEQARSITGHDDDAALFHSLMYLPDFF